MKDSNAQLWQQYNDLRFRGAKMAANKALDAFIAKFREEDHDVREQFVDEVCRFVLPEDSFVFNNGQDVSDAPVRIQHPLFKEIVLPILIERFRKNDPEAIRWIAQFNQFFYSDSSLQQEFLAATGLESYDVIPLLEKSYELEKNQLTLTFLLRELAGVLDHLTHELPSGVLATPDNFDSWIRMYETYSNQSGAKERWAGRLAWCRMVSVHWREFLENRERDGYADFSDYLARNAVDLGENYS